MADKRIVRGITMPDGTSYKPGDEAKLEKALKSEDLKRLERRGAIVGEFSGKPEQGDQIEGVADEAMPRGNYSAVERAQAASKQSAEKPQAEQTEQAKKK